MKTEVEKVVSLDIDFQPEAAVSGPVLLQTDDSVFLTFNAVRPAPDGHREDAGTAIVEFSRCSVTKFGYPNDEALPGHPLHDRGLDFYEVGEVLHSTWVRQLTEQKRFRFPHTPDSTQRHFIFTFHDSTFECVADSFVASLSTEPYEELFSRIMHKAFRHANGT